MPKPELGPDGELDPEREREPAPTLPCESGVEIELVLASGVELARELELELSSDLEAEPDAAEFVAEAAPALESPGLSPVSFPVTVSVDFRPAAPRTAAPMGLRVAARLELPSVVSAGLCAIAPAALSPVASALLRIVAPAALSRAASVDSVSASSACSAPAAASTAFPALDLCSRTPLPYRLESAFQMGKRCDTRGSPRRPPRRARWPAQLLAS